MTSPSPSTSASEAHVESASPRSLLLSLWLLGLLSVAWSASDLRDWLLESERARWAAKVADEIVSMDDETGVSGLRERTESLRRTLYDVSAEPAPPPKPILDGPARKAPQAAASPAAHELSPKVKRVLLVGASSIQFALGQALEQRLADYEGLSVRRVGKASTGLSRPDALNWPARLEQLLAEHRPTW